MWMTLSKIVSNHGHESPDIKGQPPQRKNSKVKTGFLQFLIRLGFVVNEAGHVREVPNVGTVFFRVGFLEQ